MTDLGDFFDDEQSRAARRQTDRNAAGRYEEAAVHRILALLGQSGLAQTLAIAEADRSGRFLCTFARLQEELPDLPVRFGAGRLRYLKRIAVPDLFDRFTKTPIFRALEDLATELDPAEGAIAFVFRWASDAAVETRAGALERKGIKGGKFMTIHTAPTSAAAGCTRIIRACHLGGFRCEVTIESLESLLAPLIPGD